MKTLYRISIKFDNYIMDLTNEGFEQHSSEPRYFIDKQDAISEMRSINYDFLKEDGFHLMDDYVLSVLEVHYDEDNSEMVRVIDQKNIEALESLFA